MILCSNRGLDTSAHAIEPGHLHPDRVWYQPSGWNFLPRVLRGEEVPATDVFVDFGSGKGRVLYQAAQNRFARVIGVEISAALSEAARRFPKSTFVEVRNSFHITALYDRDGCASRIYVCFATLDPGDASSALKIAEVHVVPAFAGALEDMTPAERANGDRSRRGDRQLAAAAFTRKRP